MTFILTHRGLEPSKTPYFSESSKEAFEDQLGRGFGIEFDILPKEGRFLVAHDEELWRIEAGGCHIATLEEVLDMIEVKQSPGVLSALHFKGRWQTPEIIENLLVVLSGKDVSKFFIFDVTPDTARTLKERNPNLMLAPSVAHPHDIGKYSGVVGNTLLSVEEAVAHRDLYKWAWLDEWDRKDEKGQKKFYTQETLDILRDSGFKIALVTPELHATSPALLGGESHEDALDHKTLMGRIQEILSLAPDAVCTDYPEDVRVITRP